MCVRGRHAVLPPLPAATLGDLVLDGGLGQF